MFNKNIGLFLVIMTFILVGIFVGFQPAKAVAGEGTATVDSGANVTVERTVSHVFTVVLTVGSSGITVNAPNPTFTIPAGFTVPSSSPVATSGLVMSDGGWSAIATGGDCAVDMGSASSSATGQVITVDVTGVCVTGTGVITLTYKGKSNVVIGATPIDVATADDASPLVVKSISLAPNNATLPTITVTDTVAPTVITTVTTSSIKISDNGLGFDVIATFSEPMNTSYFDEPGFSEDIVGPNDATHLLGQFFGDWNPEHTVFTRNYVIHSNIGLEALGIDVIISGAQDVAGNPLATVTTTNLFSVDTIAPIGYSVYFNQAAATSSNDMALSFTFAGAEVSATYSYYLTDFLNNISATVTGTIITGTDTISSIDISTFANGTTTLFATLIDPIGNIGAVVTTTILKDNTVPTVIITNDQSIVTNIAAGNILYIFNFNEPVTGFASGDITVGHGIRGIFATVSSTQYTQFVVPETGFEGDLTVDLAQGMVFDVAGNGNATATQYVWNVDTLAPVVTSTAPIDNAYIKADFLSTYTLSQEVASGMITFTNTSGTPDGTMHIYNLSGAGLISGGHSITQASLESGFGNSLVDGAVYDITYNATDAAGNPAITVTNTGIIYDIIAPTIAIGSPSLSLTSSTAVTYAVTYTGADTVTLSNVGVTLNATGTVTADYNVTGTGTSTRLITISNITGDGTLGISIAEATASDVAGNTALTISLSATFIVDNTGPTSTIDGFLSVIKATSRNQLVTITYSESMNPSSTPAIGFSGGSLIPATAGSWSYSNTIWQQTFTDSVDEEIVSVTVTSSGATDLAGNLESTNINGDNNPFNIDTQPPAGYSASIDQTYINNANRTSTSLTFASADIGTTYNYSIDDTTGAFTSAITGTGIIVSTTDQIIGIDVSSLNDEALILTVSLTDAVGNQGSDATSTVVKDTSSPTTSVATPVAGTYIGTQSVSLSSVGSDNIRYTVDGSSPSCSSGLTVNPFSISASKIVNVIGCDTAGNWSTTSFTYTINAPTINHGGGGAVITTLPIILGPFIVVGGVSSTLQDIALNFFVTNTSQMAISEDPTFIKASWETYTSSKLFTLSNDFGGKIVYVKFRSKDGGVTETYKVNVNFAEKGANSLPVTTAVTTFEVNNSDSKIIIVPVKKLQYSPNSLVNYVYQYKNESNKTIKIKVVRQIVDANGGVVNKRIGSTSIAKNKVFRFNASNTISNKLADGIYAVQIKIMDAKTGKIFGENGFNITVKTPIVIKKVGNSFKK